jgi:hypothetical protein
MFTVVMVLLLANLGVTVALFVKYRNLKDGRDGVDGSHGEDGRDGVDGTDAGLISTLLVTREMFC